MHPITALNSSWQTLLLAVPFLLAMLAGVFRLDELVVAQKQPSQRQRLASGIDENGCPVLFDPDGRPSN